ncbi:MAG: hypothetical protein AAFU03_14360, partial [Bacteroidota bacterium]
MLIVVKISGAYDHSLLAELMQVCRIEYLLPALFYFYISSALEQKLQPKKQIILLSPFILFSTLYTFLLIIDIFDYHYLEYIESVELYFTTSFFLLVAMLSVNKVEKAQSSNSFKIWIYTNIAALTLFMAAWLVLDQVEILLQVNYWRVLLNGMALFLIAITYFGVQNLHIQLVASLPQYPRMEQKKLPTKTMNKTAGAPHFRRIQQLML